MVKVTPPDLQAKNKIGTPSEPPVTNPLGSILDLASTAGDTFLKARLGQKAGEIKKEVVSDIDRAVAESDGIIDNNEIGEGQTGPVVDLSQHPVISALDSTTSNLMAARDQGKLTGTAFVNKMDATVKSAINRHPEWEDEIRQIAANKLGFSPEHTLFRQRMKEEETVKTLQDKIVESLINDAVEDGNLVSDGKGGYDIERTAAAQMNFAKNKKDKAAIADRVANQDIDYETTRSMAQRAAIDGQDAIMDPVINQMFDLLEEAQRQGVGPEEMEKYRAPVLDRLDTYAREAELWMGSTLGLKRADVDDVLKTLETGKARVNAAFDAGPARIKAELEIIQNTLKLEARDAFPALFILKELAGDFGSAGDLSMVAAQPELTKAMQKILSKDSVGKLDTPELRLLQRVKQTLDTPNIVSIINMDNQEATDYIKTIANLSMHKFSDPTMMKATDRQDWFNMQGKLATAALVTLDASSTENAVKYFNNPHFARTMDTLSKDPQFAKQTEILSDVMRSVAMRNLNFNVGALENAAIDIQDIVNIHFNPESGLFESKEADLNAAKRQFELLKQQRSKKGTTNVGTSVAQSIMESQQRLLGTDATAAFTEAQLKADKILQSLNNSLELVERSQPYDETAKQLSRLQLRELAASRIALRIPKKAGTKSTLSVNQKTLQFDDEKIQSVADGLSKSIKTFTDALNEKSRKAIEDEAIEYFKKHMRGEIQ